MAQEKMANGKLAKRNMTETNYFLTVTVIILLIVLMASAGLVYFHIILRLENRICRSKECWMINTELITSIDSTSDPCDNFTQFICNSREETSLEEKVMQMRVKKILKQGTVERWEPLERVRKFYESCRDTNSIDQVGNHKILSIIHKLTKWPLRNPNKETFGFNLTKFLGRSLDMNLPFEWLFRMSVKTVTLQNIIVTMVQLAPPEELYDVEDEMSITTYIGLIHTTLTRLCNCKSITRDDVVDIVKFEINLGKLWGSFDSSKTILVSKGSLSNIFSDVDVSILIKWLPETVSQVWISIDKNVTTGVDLLLTRTSKWTLSNFLVWKVVERYGFFLDSVLRERFEHFYCFDSREDLCLSEADKRYPMVLELFYKNFYLKSETKFPGIKEMASTIKTTIASKIESKEWIDRTTKNSILKKLNGMNLILTETNVDNTLIQVTEASVDELNDTSSDIFDVLDVQNRLLLKTRQMFINLTSMDLLEILRRPVPKLVEYNEETNELVFSHNVLDDYIFNTEQPSYMNYGLLGTRIAREMTKSIQRNAQYDDSQSPLWNSMNGTDFELFVRTDCLGNRDDDPDAFDAIFADIVGVNFAYEAYLEEERYAENRQLFWKVYGMNSCNNTRLDMLKHSRYFGEDYECMAGSHMNPLNKCIVF